MKKNKLLKTAIILGASIGLANMSYHSILISRAQSASGTRFDYFKTSNPSSITDNANIIGCPCASRGILIFPLTPLTFYTPQSETVGSPLYYKPLMGKNPITTTSSQRAVGELSLEVVACKRANAYAASSQINIDMGVTRFRNELNQEIPLANNFYLTNRPNLICKIPGTCFPVPLGQSTTDPLCATDQACLNNSISNSILGSGEVNLPENTFIRTYIFHPLTQGRFITSEPLNFMLNIPAGQPPGLYKSYISLNVSSS